MNFYHLPEQFTNMQRIDLMHLNKRQMAYNPLAKIHIYEQCKRDRKELEKQLQAMQNRVQLLNKQQKKTDMRIQDVQSKTSLTIENKQRYYKQISQKDQLNQAAKIYLNKTSFKFHKERIDMKNLNQQRSLERLQRKQLDCSKMRDKLKQWDNIIKAIQQKRQQKNQQKKLMVYQGYQQGTKKMYEYQMLKQSGFYNNLDNQITQEENQKQQLKDQMKQVEQQEQNLFNKLTETLQQEKIQSTNLHQVKALPLTEYINLTPQSKLKDIRAQQVWSAKSTPASRYNKNIHQFFYYDNTPNLYNMANVAGKNNIIEGLYKSLGKNNSYATTNVTPSTRKTIDSLKYFP